MERPFEHVAIVGTGLLGTQIAMLSAYAGYKVSVYDTREGAFDETYDKLFADLKAKVVNPFTPGTIGQNAGVESPLQPELPMRSRMPIW